ncbi:MAG: DNA alkylation repair protein [bacterium]|nr:DNA alkylation repair protein [bacterium]
MKIRQEIDFFKETLAAGATPERAKGEKRYLKSDLRFLGATKPDARRAVASWLKLHPKLSRSDLVRLSQALWKRRVHELRSVAGILLKNRWHLLETRDLDAIEWMLRHSHSWAYVDELAVHVVGPIVDRDPEAAEILDRWAEADDFWIRRSALLALLLPLRRGEGDWSRFVRYADLMLEEREFFIRKAIGWVLRETSKKEPDLVADFLESRVARTSGVTFREAVKYLPARQATALKRARDHQG